MAGAGGVVELIAYELTNHLRTTQGQLTASVLDRFEEPPHRLQAIGERLRGFNQAHEDLTEPND